MIYRLPAGGKKLSLVLLMRWRSVLFVARFLVRFVAFDRELGRRYHQREFCYWATSYRTLTSAVRPFAFRARISLSHD